MPEWLVERGLGETRSALIDGGEIVEARIELEGVIAAGAIASARLVDIGRNGRNAVARDGAGTEYLLPRGASGATEGAEIMIEITRSAIPGAEPWKRPLARLQHQRPPHRPERTEEFGRRELSLPATKDELSKAGWDDLMEQARTGLVPFAGGELWISPTPAMTLVDVDGYLAPDELAMLGASEAAKAIRRLDIGGSIGIDLPTSGSKSARQRAAEAIDAELPQPFERTAVNGFGFVQIVRPRSRASLVELAGDRAAFEARALLRRVAFEPPGPKRLVAHPAVVGVLQGQPDWLELLAGPTGGAVSLRAEPNLPMSGGYAEKA
ncbi:MAG: ribonuclease [Sphingomicrobium sp.]